MTTIQVISKTEFNKQYKNKTGSLMFPSNYWDCLHYCDEEKLKSNLPTPLPKGAKILYVLIHTDASPDYKNIANTLVPYRTPLCADRNADGAYYYTSRHGFSMWAVNHPVGDAIIVINKK
jgi:hypothetical protein